MNQLTGIGTELANLSFDQLELFADSEGDDARIQVSVCGRFNLAQLAEGESGEGTSRVCSVLRAFVKIRLEKSVLEKTLRVRAFSQKKFPRRALNLRNVVHVRSELSHVRSKMP